MNVLAEREIPWNYLLDRPSTVEKSDADETEGS